MVTGLSYPQLTSRMEKDLTLKMFITLSILWVWGVCVHIIVEVRGQLGI